MKLIIDANVVISALIADSKTRELIVTLEHTLVTPAFVFDEIENYEALIVEKSGVNCLGVKPRGLSVASPRHTRLGSGLLYPECQAFTGQ